MFIETQPATQIFVPGPTGLGFAGLVGLLLTAAISPKRGPPAKVRRVIPLIDGWKFMRFEDRVIATWPFAIGSIGFGLTGLAFGNFWLQWQFLPAEFAGRGLLAGVGNGLLVVAGACLFWPVAARWAAWLLMAFYALWAVTIHAARLVTQPLNAGAWLPVTEVLGLAIGASALALLLAATPRPHAMRALRVALGLCALNFGICHFVYLDITASMVPGWFPAPHFWAAATGAAHLAAGASLVAGPLARLAATLLAVMIAGFGLLVHVPRVIGTPSSHMEWAMLFIAVTLAGAIWLVATGLGSAPESSGRAWPFMRRTDEAVAG